VSRLWYLLLPNNAYALSFRFEHPVTEREARAHMRLWLGVSRLPNGSQVWRG